MILLKYRLRLMQHISIHSYLRVDTTEFTIYCQQIGNLLSLTLNS